MEEYKSKYNSLDYNKIDCKSFGRCDGMNAGCHYCLERNPYQWEMCSDETWKRGLMNSILNKIPKTENEAIEFIDNYKKKHY